jgi:hypothetical protein
MSGRASSNFRLWQHLADMDLWLRQSASCEILLQNSKVASVRIFGEILKREAIDVARQIGMTGSATK